MTRSHRMRRFVILGVGFCGLVCGSEARGGDPAPLPCITYPDQRFFGMNASSSDSVGGGVAISGDLAVAGGYQKVHILRRDGSTWFVEQVVQPNDGPSSGYGGSVAISGNVIVVGAPYDNDNGSELGSAYVLRYKGGQWVQEAKLLAFDGLAGDQFGWSVAVWGDVAVVGAPLDGVIGNWGSVYVYRFDGSTWQFEQNLMSADAAYYDTFGRAVAIWDDTLIVGAPGDDGPAGLNVGSAYVFVFNGSAWVEEQKFLPPVDATDFLFGWSVAIENETVVVGMPSTQYPGGDTGGAAYVFGKEQGSWFELVELTGFDVDHDDLFGYSVAISGDRIVVGAPWKQIPGAWLDGSAYAFRQIDGEWIGKCALHGSSAYHNDNSAGENFGGSVGVSGEVAIVRSPYEGITSDVLGSAYFFSPYSDCNENSLPDACDAPDCNGNQQPDSCDISAGLSDDCNANGVPDECEAPFQYQVDDGTAEGGLGYNSSQFSFDFIWLNQFTVLTGGEFIDRIGILWTSHAPSGDPVILLVYDDPNNDGIPDDAILLANQEARTRDYGFGPGIATMAAYERIPATFVGNAGDSFFVGVKSEVYPPAFPAPIDMNTPRQDRSWVAASVLGKGDTVNLANNGTLERVNYNLALRAMSSDCNGNGVWDGCDISDGVSADEDGNGIPDECEVTQCLGDIAPEGALDGVVNVGDLLAVISAWGSARGAADINGDGIVDVVDLLAVVGNWGPCE